MSRYEGRHAEGHPITGRPEAGKYEGITLVDPSMEAGQSPVRPPLPAPVHGPVFLPDLPPAPPPMPAPAPPPHPRMAWVPARHSAPPMAVLITMGAVLARETTRYATVCAVRCQRQGCTQASTRGGSRTFADLYLAAEADGWRKDAWGAWMCPRCQQKPGYWPANVPAPVSAWAELGLAWTAKEAAGDGYRLRETIRHEQALMNGTGEAA